MKYAFLKDNRVMKVLNVDWLDAELYAIRCEDVDVHAEDTYQDGAFYRNGEPLQTHEQSVQAALEVTQAELNAVYDAAQGLSDEVAITVPMLFPEWKEDTNYFVGDRVRYDGALYRCLQGHAAIDEWNPIEAVSLWASVLAGQGGTEIGEWVQPNSTNPYQQGDRVTHNGKTWESSINGNVWEPGVYGWNEVNE